MISSSPESECSSYFRNRRRESGRSKESHKHRKRYSRSRSGSYSKDRSYRRSPEKDLYKDLIDQDYADYDRDRDRDRDRIRHRDRRSRERDRDRRDRETTTKRGYSPIPNLNEEFISGESYDSDNNEFFYHQKPNNKIIVRGLLPHITEADINSDLIQCGLQAVHVRLVRRKKTGASRGFAFVEFRTEEEATRWICYKQGVLIFNDHRAVMQYTYMKDFPAPIEPKKDKPATDWYCGKCGVFNFKRRENCFKCFASREESEKGGEGSDEISNILTKKIMLRNLDVLTNEESVLCLMQDVIPSLVSKISKILICRDPLTSTSRGICYLHFDNLVDSMNTHNALKALDVPLKIDNREVLISYCMDTENRTLIKSTNINKNSYSEQTQSTYANTYQYSLADVPRLAEYSASVYASNTAEHEHYIKFYTNYYITQINLGQISNLPTMNQLGETANSGAAVAQSAIQRKQKASKCETTSTVVVTQHFQIPNGVDGKKYDLPDINLYQYDETSGYYYDPATGLYFDAHSQYYYNNETNAYLYWDNENCTYVAANTSTPSEASSTTVTQPSCSTISENNDNVKNDGVKERQVDKTRQEKVKVAKKIVKDMEKWAKQLNQKKEYNVMYAPVKADEVIPQTQTQTQSLVVAKTSEAVGGYADVGFALLEKKERVQAVSNYLMNHAKQTGNKLVASSYGSDSENEQEDANDKDYVDFEKLTCLLCKRAFQSLEILNKHLEKSALHRENLQKFNSQHMNNETSGNHKGEYRDRAKERRLKYGEVDPPPINKSKERFQKEMEKQAAVFQPNNVATVPIGENNVGNKLLQKMGWSEGQGLGRSNQGRTNIIEAETRVSNAGLGSKFSTYGTSGDDYKTYIKKMMKSRYEQVDIKD